MPFDAGPGEEPSGAPFEHYQEPIDYFDWATRIVAFGALLGAYALWIWNLLGDVLKAFMRGLG